MSIRLYLNEDSQNVLWDWAFTTMDLDMDSDNNNGYEEPDRTVKEEETEKQEGHPGKIIRLNDGDINQNDIPDFAEFEYIDSKGIKLNKKLVPFVVEIPGHVEIEEATIKFEYTGSDPLNIAQAPDPTDNTTIVYTPAEGSQRLWLKNADEKRNPLGISEGGDYVTPNAEYTLLQLGFENSKRIKILYIEGIRATEAGAATTRVYLEYQP
jgi:hypothetical protein